MAAIYKKTLSWIFSNLSKSGWVRSSAEAVSAPEFLLLEKVYGPACVCHLKFWVLSRMGRFQDKTFFSIQGSVSIVDKRLEDSISSGEWSSILLGEDGVTAHYSLQDILPAYVGNSGVVFDAETNVEQDCNELCARLDGALSERLRLFDAGEVYRQSLQDEALPRVDLIDWVAKKLFAFKELHGGVLGEADLVNLKSTLRGKLLHNYSNLERLGILSIDRKNRDEQRLMALWRLVERH